MNSGRVLIMGAVYHVCTSLNKLSLTSNLLKMSIDFFLSFSSCFRGWDKLIKRFFNKASVYRVLWLQ